MRMVHTKDEPKQQLVAERKQSTSSSPNTGVLPTGRLVGQKRGVEAMLSPSQTPTVNPATLSPADVAIRAFNDNGFDVTADPSILKLLFITPNEAMIQAYKTETLHAARTSNIEKLRQLHADGVPLECCNRFGESLMHLACRRGSTEVVRFLIAEAGVSILVKDDYGRTPLHDACWTPTPNFDLVALIVEEYPELLCIKDCRGHTPLNYVRNEHWHQWRSFLAARSEGLRPKAKEVTPLGLRR